MELRWPGTASAWSAAVFVGLSLSCAPALAGNTPRVGSHPDSACQKDGCNYYLAKGQCAFAADGATDLVAMLNGKPVKLKFKERRPIFRKVPDRKIAIGNRFVARYDSVDSPDGAVQVQILDTVYQPLGACEPGVEGCTVTHYRSQVRITAPRAVVEFQGTGVCRPVKPTPAP